MDRERFERDRAAARQSSFAERMAQKRARQMGLEAVGIPALERLVAVGKRRTGQSDTVRRFLLGLYNGPAFPFVLTDLRGLDREIQEDALAVLEMDMTPRFEIHHFIEGGGELLDDWAEQMREADDERSNR